MRFSGHLLFLAISLLCLCGPLHGYAKDAAQPAELKQANQLIKAGLPDSAIAVVNRLMAGSQQDIGTMVQAMGVKATALTQLHKTKEATALYFEALKLCRHPADDAQASFICNELGYLFFEEGDFSTAKTYFRQDLAIKRQMRDSDGVGDQLINLAGIHRLLKEYDSTAILLKEVSGILLRQPDPALSGYYHNATGNLMQATNRLDSAVQHYQEAIYFFRLSHKYVDLFKALYNTGALQVARGRYPEAIGYLLQSERLADSLHATREKMTISKGLAEAYASVKNFDKAYQYRTQYAQLSDSLKRTELNTAIAELDKKFQTEKNRETIQQQEIELQAARNRTLWVVILLIVLAFALLIFTLYAWFRRRVNKQVEAAKEKFFSNVVHEIRTPLSMIQAPVELLKKNNTDAASKTQLELAERNIHRLNELISQMLDLSKIDAAKYQLKADYGDLAEFIPRIAAPFEAQAATKQQKLLLQADPGPAYAYIDKDALEKIIGNLLSNALKYTPAGGTIGLDASAVQQDGQLTLNLTVWDTGIGMTKDEQARIFDRFYRSAAQQQAGVKGIGIGLSLVKELVDLMQGTISVQSEPGKGSAFSLGIPLKLKAEPKPHKPSVSGASVLLVEDDAEILGFNKQLLGDEGYHVMEARDGLEALELLHSALPDLVITDRMMPGTDGLELLKNIRTEVSTAHIPVIMLSAKGSADSKMEALSAGAQAYMVKPFSPAELLAIVKNQLDILQKRQNEFKALAESPGKSIEEKYKGTEPYTQKLFALIFEKLPDPELTVEKLADLMATNRSHFQRKIKSLTGFSPSELLRAIRLEKAKTLLLARSGNVTEVAYQVGFSSQSHFTRSFTQHFGIPPTQMLQNAK